MRPPVRKLPSPPKPRSLPTKHRDKPKAPAVIKGHAGSSVMDHSYSPETRHLTITFRRGQQYRYEGVDPKTAAAFKGADSQGSFLHSSIIGKFTHSKIED